jgi:hypothetical protein
MIRVPVQRAGEPLPGEQQLANRLFERERPSHRELITDVGVLSVTTPRTFHRTTRDSSGAAFRWAVTPQRDRNIALWGESCYRESSSCRVLNRLPPRRVLPRREP